MKIPHLKTTLFKSKKEAFVGIMIVMLATTFLNIVPELGQSLASLADEQVIAQAPSGSMTTHFYVVNTQEGGSSGPTCTLQVPGPINQSIAEECMLSTAISQANVGGPETITIIFANSLPQIILESVELPIITRTSAPLFIDGCQNADCSVKEIIKGNIDNEWAFKIDTIQGVTIRNMAFISLPDPESAAIRSNEKSPPWDLGKVLIENNYFGTTDGQTFVSNNVIMNGIILFIDKLSLNSIDITTRNNTFYGVQGTPIAITAKEDGGEDCGNINNEGPISSAAVQISNNNVGIKKNGSGGEGGYQSGDEWGDVSTGSIAGILVCGVNAEIANNIIGNSRFNDSVSSVFAIFSMRSHTNIHHNQIGALNSGTSINSNIYGSGIILFLNYATGGFLNSNQVHDNLIGNIKRGDCNDNIYNNDPGKEACSGNAMVIFSNNNLIYNNEIGGETIENEGYGIAFGGIVTASGSGLPTSFTSNSNKVFKNTISYNKADGVFIAAPQKINIPDPFTQFPDFKCADSSSGSIFPPQNCFNSLSQNQIFRNGRYDELDAPGFPEAPPFPSGGIGIDLKSGSGSVDPDNHLEQKEGVTASPNGTHNDSDITFNDFGDDDLGANDLMNYPIIHPNTGTPTPNSTATEIHGDLNTSKEGRFWVEVFRVRCDAEDDDNTNVNAIDALTGQCDTDEKNLGMGPGSILVNGQGFEFVCGSYVTKSSTNAGEWDCKPEDFGIDFNGGLITATATEIKDVDAPLTFGQSIVPAVSLKYTCELAGIVFGTSVNGAGQPCNGKAGTSDYTDLRGLEANIIQALGNSSEFSQDIFIPTPDLSINKKIRGCTGTTKESCTINSFQTETTASNSTTVEYRVDAFNNGNNSLAINVGDIQPSGITFNQAQCEYFIVDTVTDTRPGTGAQPCSFTAMNLGLPGGSGTIALPNKKHLVVYLLATVNGTGTITNIANVTESSLCPSGSGALAINCTSEARVIVQTTPGDVTLTKTVVPSTVTSGTSPQDVTYTVTMTKEAGTAISNDTWSDTFPTTPVTMTYKDCTVTVTPASASAGFNCPTFPQPTAPSPGNLHAGNIAKEITQIIYTYKGTVPANAVTSGTGAIVTNTTDFVGFNGTTNLNKQASANLTILPPGSTGSGSVTLKHVFDNADTGAMISTVTSGGSIINKDYFIVVSFNNIPTSGITGFKLANNFAVTTSNLNTPLTYSDCQINYFGVTPSGAPVTCTIPSIGGNVDFYPTGLNVPQGLTKIIVRYQGHVPANAVGASSTATVINHAVVDAPGISDVVRAQATASADATLNINGPGAPAGSGTISMTKVADNNVTGTDHSNERVYKPDETVNYTVNILNNGTGAANGVTMRDSVSRNLTTLTNDPLPSGSSGGFSENNLTVSGLTVATGSTGVTIKYRGILKGNSQFDLSGFDLDSNADPARDEDFYAPSDADIDENIDITNNKHKDENESLDTRDNKFVSLGNGGDIVIDLGKKVIVDGSGDDFGILEIDHNTDDKDQATEGYTVLVSQDGDTFEKVSSGSSDTDQFDLGRADMTWARFIKIEDDSIETKADAPGADIDAICLFNIGVQLPNTAEVQFGDQRLSDGENVTVDVTDVFDDQLDDSDCVEPEAPAPVIVFPPGPPNVVVPPPERLPITGSVAAFGIFSALIAWRTRKKKNSKF